MQPKLVRIAPLLSLLAVAPLLMAQQPAAANFGNSDVLAMLKARLPQTTIVSTIEAAARRGTAHFDVSPQALVALGQAGANEAVLNTLLWAANDVDVSMETPRPRGAFYRSGDNVLPLRGFTMWPPFLARFSVFQRHAVEVAMGAAVSPVSVGEATPTISVQGFGADANWQLVSLGRAGDHRTMTVRSRNAFGGDFFSDNVFDKRDLRPIAIVSAAPDSFAVRPEMPLAPGSYALCGQPTEGGWMRVCYEFAVRPGA